MDENNQDENIESDDEEVYYDNRNENAHGKLVDNLANLHFNYKTETDASGGSKTKTSTKHEVRDDAIVSFNKKNIWVLNK